MTRTSEDTKTKIKPSAPVAGRTEPQPRCATIGVLLTLGMAALVGAAAWSDWVSDLSAMRHSEQMRVSAIAETVAAGINGDNLIDIWNENPDKNELTEWSPTSMQSRHILGTLTEARQANGLPAQISLLRPPPNYVPGKSPAPLPAAAGNGSGWLWGCASVRDSNLNVTAIVAVGGTVDARMLDVRGQFVQQAGALGLCFITAEVMIVLLMGSKNRSERELRKLALVASRTDNAVIITDAEGLIEWVNEGFTRITGYSQREAIGRKPGSFLQGAATDPATVQHIRYQLSLHRGFTAELVNYAKDGRAYWVSIDVQPIYDRRGRVTNFIAIERDVSQQKATEQALRESEMRVRLVMDNAPGAVITANSIGRIVDWNAQATELFGFTAEEAIGRPADRMILPGRMWESSEDKLLRLLQVGPDMPQRRRLRPTRRAGTTGNFRRKFRSRPCMGRGEPRLASSYRTSASGGGPTSAAKCSMR